MRVQLLLFKKEQKLLFGSEMHDSTFDFLVQVNIVEFSPFFHAYALASHKYLSIRGKWEEHVRGPEWRDDWYQVKQLTLPFL